LDRLRENAKQLKGKLGFVVLYRPKTDESQDYCFLIRKIKIMNTEWSGDFIYVEFQNLDLADYTKNISDEIVKKIKDDFSREGWAYTTNFSEHQINQAFISETREDEKWVKIINKISEINDFRRDVFLKLRRIKELDGKENAIQSDTGIYKIKGSANYELEVIQSVGEKSLGKVIDTGVTITPLAPESHITFITKDATILSRYDLLKILFRTKKRAKSTKTILTLLPNREKISQARSTKDKMPTAMAEPEIAMDIGISSDIWWIIALITGGLALAAFGTAYASKDFVADKAVLGSLLSAVGAILSATLGIRYLSEE